MSDQFNLFEVDECLEWSKEWQDMPEFIQKDARPLQQITISFEKWEDVQAFAKLINQRITEKTNSVWFPEMKLEKPSNFIYTDEP